MQKLGPDHYRYEATLNPDGVNIECHTYVVIGETPKCYWVIRDGSAGYAALAPNSDFVKRHRKLVLKAKGGRRHCYPDRMAALDSLLIRKERQLQHIKRQTSVANLAIKRIKYALASNQEIGNAMKCGHDDYTSRLVWNDD